MASLSLRNLLVAIALLANSKIADSLAHQGPGEPLFLTPLIKEGRNEEARELAFGDEFGIVGYSGFVTVNEEYGSNLFFWYYPAEPSHNTSDDDIPLLLWLNGGPGDPSLNAVFSTAGPFLPTSEETFEENPLSWHKKYHMIYLDNPVELGFSHTNHPDGYIYSSAAAAKDIYEFLIQFLKMFPSLQNNPFYPTGISFGGRYTTELAYYIHNANSNAPELQINLVGLVEDGPLFEAETQIDYANTGWSTYHFTVSNFNKFIISRV